MRDRLSTPITPSSRQRCMNRLSEDQATGLGALGVSGDRVVVEDDLRVGGNELAIGRVDQQD